MGNSSLDKEKGSYQDRRDQRAHSPRRQKSSKSWSTRDDRSQDRRRSGSIAKESTFTHKRAPANYGRPLPNYRQ